MTTVTARWLAGLTVAATLQLVAVEAARATTPAPSVAIVAPAAGTPTNASSLAVDVRFAAALTPLLNGTVHTIVLTLDEREVGRHANPPWMLQGTHRFAVDLSSVQDGTRALQAFAYQGLPPVQLEGRSTPVPVVVDRTPPALTLDAPGDGRFVREAQVSLHGTASDAGSGLAELSCADRALAPAAAFSCDAALSEGLNELVVRAVDRAGNARERQVTVDHFPGGLAGMPSDPATDATRDVFEPQARVSQAEITGGVIRTQLELAFALDATVAQVNGLLRELQASIVSQREGVAIAVVRIPDPGSLSAVDAVVDGLAGRPELRRASHALVPEPAMLPAHIEQHGETELVRHQLAARAGAAWNASVALTDLRKPTLVIGDYFGAGPPPSAEFDVLDRADFGTARPRDHGYSMLGIIGGAFDPGAARSFRVDAVTGMFPDKLAVRAVDLTGSLSGGTSEDLLVKLIDEAPGDVVLNTSLSSWPCNTAEEVARNCSEDNARARALAWIERVRGTKQNAPGTNVEHKYVHATSAGNVKDVGPLGAQVRSSWNAAVLQAPLVDPATGQRVDNLANTLVIENFAASHDEPYAPACLSPSSELGGTIGAIGAPVHTFQGPEIAGTDADGGTSSATAQVTGLAAYVWTLRPDLDPAQLVGLVERTARSAGAGCGGGGVIDAYAAVLATDEGNPARRVRRAILDVADDRSDHGENGAFDRHDIRLLLETFAGPQAGAIDYGRHDLNGSGTTGARDGVETVDRFDLDADGSHGLAEADIEDVAVRFDETQLSDEQVLCHSAYSSVFVNTADDLLKRDDLLGLKRCLDLRLDHQFPATVRAGDSNLLSITAVNQALPEDVAGQEGLRIELTPAGGTVDEFAGTTNADGIFQTDASLFEGQTQLVIEVIARAREGGPELARTTVRASIAEIKVTVSPEAAKLVPGESQQFTATVTGANNPDVKWSASGGTITEDGTYTAAPPEGRQFVRATSVENPTKSAVAFVTVDDVFGLYEGTFTDDVGNVSPVNKSTGLVNLGDVAFNGEPGVWLQVPPGYNVGTAPCLYRVAPTGSIPPTGGPFDGRRRYCVLSTGLVADSEPQFSARGSVSKGGLVFDAIFHGDEGPGVLGTFDLTECHFFNTRGLEPLCS